MKRFLLSVVQFFVFLVVFAVGSFAAPFGVRWGMDHLSATTTRFFIADGLLLTLGLFVLILLVEALAKRLRSMGGWTTLAAAAAILIGLALKLGFVTREM